MKDSEQDFQFVNPKRNAQMFKASEKYAELAEFISNSKLELPDTIAAKGYTNEELFRQLVNWEFANNKYQNYLKNIAES